MSFAQVVERLTEDFASGTSHEMDLPAAGLPGELFLAAFVTGASSTVTEPDGWTERINATSPAGQRLCVYLKLSETGDYGGTVDFVTSGSITGRAILLRIASWSGTVSEVQAGTSASGTNAAPNPPSLNPTGGARDDLWIAIGTFNRTSVLGGATSFSDAPSNYTDLTTVGTPGVSVTLLATSERELNATSEDPGVFTMSGSTNSSAWIGATLNVPPGASGLPPSGSGALVLPFPVLAGTGLHKQHGSGALVLPFPIVEAAGLMLPEATGALALPFPVLTGAGENSRPATGTGALTLPFPVLAGTGTHPIIEGTGALTLPFPSLAGAGTFPYVGTGAFVLPFPVLSGTGVHVEYVRVSIPLAATGAARLAARVAGGMGKLARPVMSGRARVNRPTSGGRGSPNR